MINLPFVRLISSRFSGSVRSKGFFSFSKTVAFVSVMLGSMALLLSLAVLDGFDDSLHSIAASFSAHIQVRYSSRVFGFRTQALCDELKRASPDIVVAEPVLQFEGLIYRKGCTEGVVVKSDTKQPATVVTSIQRQRRILSGTEIGRDSDGRALLIGRKLASKLRSKVGDTVIVTFTQHGVQDLNAVSTIPFYIKGIYETGMSQYDDVYVYAAYDQLLALLGEESRRASSIELWLRDATQAPLVAKKLKNAFDFQIETVTVDELHRGMFAWIDLQKKPVPIVLGLISIVAVFNILTTLLISIVEKSSSYAVLLTLGMKSKELLATVAWQGLIIGTLGTTCGCAIALTFCILQRQFGLIHLDGDIYFLDKLPIAIVGWHYAIVMSISIGLSTLATFVPGFIATRISPVAALRFK